MPGDAPIVVNSAGCGAAMKEYGHLLGTPEAVAFAARVRDFSEWLAATGPLPLGPQSRTGRRPGSRATSATCRRPTVRCATVLGAAYDLRETDDDGLCCGAGGAYAVSQPELAGEIRDRKLAGPASAQVQPRPGAVVASANPGCLMHLRAAGLDVRHPADLLAEALLDGDCDE